MCIVKKQKPAFFKRVFKSAKITYGYSVWQ